MQPVPSPSGPTPSLRQRAWLGVALVSLLVVFHHFAWPLLPDRSAPIPPAAMQPLGAAPSAAYLYPFTAGLPDRPQNPQSRVRLFEDETPLEIKTRPGPRMFPVRGGAWMHVPGYIVFSASDNSDPRSGHHRYTLRYPPLTAPWAGQAAGLLFALAVFMLWRGHRSDPAVTASPGPDHRRWRRHLVGVSLLLVAGLYCNTGTLAPYAITSVPQIDPATGYLYNVDHREFRALFNLVDGTDRSQWEHGLLLRRILYPVLAWPFMHFIGFKTGGVLANLVFAWAGLMLTVAWLRTRVGERGAVIAGWLLACYPGAAYWAGLPYLYALIFPLSLLLTLALMDLDRATTTRQVALLSLAMGVAYLAYDFAVFFLPASLLVLGRRRRWGWASLSLAGQMLPLVGWLLMLRYGLGVSPLNSNSSVYGTAVAAYFQSGIAAGWGDAVVQAPMVAWHVWFGSNFFFLPALALAAFAINPLTSRIRLAPAEATLLAVAAALFLFTNLAPDVDVPWKMRGSWISRLYQPLFAVLVIYIARWWQHLPSGSALGRWSLRLGLAAILAGNAAVVFGPILGNPGRLSGDAFYRFYTHTDVILIDSYEANLREHGRRPLGFPRPTP